MTVREFFRVLRERWRLVFLCLLLVVAAAALTTMTTAKVYQSTARVYFSSTTTATRDQPAEERVVNKNDLTTYVEVLSSPEVLDALRAQVGLAPGAPLGISATVSETTNVLDITATGADPELVSRIANAAAPVLAKSATQFSVLLASGGQAVTATVLLPAGVPGEPLSPRPTRNLVLGGFIGLGLGIGVAVLRHVADTKVRGEEDIKALSERPILGSIPFLKDDDEISLAFEHAPHTRYAEAIRRLRTNLLFVDVTTQGHSFVVTSANASEGKTSTSINLAMALADAGSKVLLIDGDLRNPSVASRLHLEGEIGLTTLLLGQARPDEVIMQWGDTSLHVLASGQIPPNPSELLGSEAMHELFQKLSQEFDFILVDSPPINPVIDAVLINRLTRGLVMVVAAGQTRKRDLESALSSLSTVDVAVAGFALNLAPASSQPGYKYGQYGYGRTAQTHAATRRGAIRKRKGLSLRP